MGKPHPYQENLSDLKTEFAAHSGQLKYHLEKDHIFLDMVSSIGQGSGTRAMRCLVKESLARNFDGCVKLQANYSSHLFHLLMGMVPEEGQLDYLYYKHSFSAPPAVEALRRCQSSQQIPISELDTLKDILAYEKKIPKETITKDVIFDNKAFLLSLKNKKLSSLQTLFIPAFLDVLKELKAGKPRPDTSHLTAVNMVLSDAGKTRWKKAIAANAPFEPFRDFSHLRPYMTPSQQKKFDEILGVKQAACCSTLGLFAVGTMVSAVALASGYALSM